MMAHRLTGFSSMDTVRLHLDHERLLGAPPDGFLIDGHDSYRRMGGSVWLGAPPDGFLIDGHGLTYSGGDPNWGRTA